MAQQLTSGLLATLIENAQAKAQQTLGATATLAPFVFAGTSLLWYVPPAVNHPLRRVLGLSQPFILITAAAPGGGGILAVQRSACIVSGAEPLAEWTSLASGPSGLAAMGRYDFEWGVQRLQPLDRNKARVLTAQYAQILPELRGADEGAGLELPMAVFTREIEQAALDVPFYLVVFSPRTPAGFANVVAVRARSEPLPQAHGAVPLLDVAGDCTLQTQHWAEYDLFGSPALAEHAAAALVGRETVAEAGSVEPPSSMPSYAVLHGVWRSETRGSSCVAPLPPVPQPSAQWILELLSMPLSQDPDASKPLQALRMEIGRLETWCQCWMAGERWATPADDSSGPATFRTHPWQSQLRNTRRDDEGRDITETLDESSMAVDGGAAAPALGTLERHRVDFAAKIDAFIDASIHDTRGSTALGRQGRASGVYALDGFPAREGLDFTERLWNLAHYAHDDGDLSEAVAAVAEGLETRKLQPYIHHSNKSPMAQVIRQALQMAQATTLVNEEAERERLAGQLDLWIDKQPLDPLVHIGLHKLRADFWFYFVGGHLAPPRQIEPLLDLEQEPAQLVAQLKLLLRVLEVWWLLRQAVPGMPRQFSAQIVSALLDRFAAPAAADSSSDQDSGLHYEIPLRVVAFLPVYSSEVQDFVAAVVGGFDPARYTATAAVASSGGSEPGAHQAQFSLRCLTTTPALVDQHFARDDAHLELISASASEAGGEEYTVFEATHL
ncbi:hypothetical protein H4R19_004471 [Coemansia spiralis]|nr:hypothetical protein H4R19_004471 [Coemansia spiralis]